MRHHAFGVACCARGVVDRNRVPLILGHQPRRLRVATGEEGIIVDGSRKGERPVKLWIIILHQNGFHRGQPERLLHQLHEFTVDDHDLGQLTIACITPEHIAMTLRKYELPRSGPERPAVISFKSCPAQNAGP